jgi:hypothetical protein
LPIARATTILTVRRIPNAIAAGEGLLKTLAHGNIFKVTIGLIQAFRQDSGCLEAAATYPLINLERVNYELLGNRAVSQTN